MTSDTMECPPSPTHSTTSNSSSTSLLSNTTNDSLQRGWVAPFLLHLRRMLQQESQDIVSWTKDGLAFQIRDREKLTTQVLDRYFKNKNFASFQRQLNYFGFRKWSKARCGSSPYPTYSREHFTRDNYDDMSLVKRQSKKSRKRILSSVSLEINEGSSKHLKTRQVPTYWISSDQCKRILPRPDGDRNTTTGSPLSIASVATILTSIPSPNWTLQSMENNITIPALSPTRKTSNGCKLPSIQELTSMGNTTHRRGCLA